MNANQLEYYSGGYFLMKLRSASPNDNRPRTILTCSECINDSLLDTWAISWVDPVEHQTREIGRNLQISEKKLKDIQNWVGEKINQGRIGWYQVFVDLEIIKEYRAKYFHQTKGIEILELLFPAEEREAFIEKFTSASEKDGTLGLYDTLQKRLPEIKNETHITIGYDLIGVEISGNFHTFHCHELAGELNIKFGIELNEYGLINDINNGEEIISFMNDQDNGFEPVPWFLVKVRRVVGTSEYGNESIRVSKYPVEFETDK